MKGKHRHHIVPKHMGGSDEENNLTPPISIELHAEFHKQLWEDFGNKEDFIAWRALSGRITSEEARLEAAKIGQQKSLLYKESRKITGEIAAKSRTKESCLKGGLNSIEKLLEWQRNNKELHANNVRERVKRESYKNNIPHKYKDELFESKGALQEKYKMSNTKFYKLLSEGEIERLPKPWKRAKIELPSEKDIKEMENL